MDRIPIGLNTYSLRAFRWPDLKLMDYAASLKLDGIFLQDSLDPRINDPAHWKEVKDHAAKLGLYLETGMGPSLPKTPELFNASVDALRAGIRRAAGMGAKVLRTLLAGDRAGMPPGPVAQHVETTIKVLRAVRTEAMDAGVKIAIENHKDLLAFEQRQLIEAAGKEFVGANLSTGNPVFVMEDPLETVEVLGPVALAIQLRDSAVYETRNGIAVQWVPLGEGVVDFKAIVEKAKQVCPPLHMYVMPITGRPPTVLPIYDQAYWKIYQEAKAPTVARFIALAKKGQPYQKNMVIEDVAGRNNIEPFAAALQYQQREHMERSIDYAKKSLDIGIRWRS